jgi:hypothetical protein
MFADWELIGVPHRVVIGDRGLKEGRSNTRAAATGRDQAGPADVLAHLKGQLKRPLTRRGALALLLAAPGLARAGAQVEEPLADAMRSALSAAIAQAAPPRPRFDPVDARMATCAGWAMSERLKRARPRPRSASSSWRPSGTRPSARAGAQLVLGLIQVESGYASTRSASPARAATCR